jgi:hypothetical protein
MGGDVIVMMAQRDENSTLKKSSVDRELCLVS